jgi:hypothetical protein
MCWVIRVTAFWAIIHSTHQAPVSTQSDSFDNQAGIPYVGWGAFQPSLLRFATLRDDRWSRPDPWHDESLDGPAAGESRQKMFDSFDGRQWERLKPRKAAHRS